MSKNISTKNSLVKETVWHTSDGDLVIIRKDKSTNSTTMEVGFPFYPIGTQTIRINQKILISDLGLKILGNL